MALAHVRSVLDVFLHSIPFFPGKLQGTWLDRIWERIEGTRK